MPAPSPLPRSGHESYYTAGGFRGGQVGGGGGGGGGGYAPVDAYYDDAVSEAESAAAHEESVAASIFGAAALSQRRLSAKEEEALASIRELGKKEASLLAEIAYQPLRVAEEREVMLSEFDQKASEELGSLIEDLERVRASIGLASSRVNFGNFASEMVTEVDPAVVAALREAKTVEPDLSGNLMGSPMSKAQARMFR